MASTTKPQHASTLAVQDETVRAILQRGGNEPQGMLSNQGRTVIARNWPVLQWFLAAKIPLGNRATCPGTLAPHAPCAVLCQSAELMRPTWQTEANLTEWRLALLIPRGRCNSLTCPTCPSHYSPIRSRRKIHNTDGRPSVARGLGMLARLSKEPFRDLCGTHVHMGACATVPRAPGLCPAQRLHHLSDPVLFSPRDPVKWDVQRAR